MGNITGKSVVDESVMEKLRCFDGTGASFKQIIKDLTDEDKKKLDKYFEIWKIGCLYKLMRDTNNDLGYVSPDILSQFVETEGAVLNSSDLNAKMSLYYATGDKRYLPDNYHPSFDTIV